MTITRRRRHPKHTRLKGDGRQVYIRIRGKLHAKVFPLTEPLEKLYAWRDEQKRIYGGAAEAGSLADNVATYLARKQTLAMRCFGDRERKLTRWLQELGRDRPRQSVTKDDVNDVLQTLLNEGYKASYVVGYKVALKALYDALDPDGYNPVHKSMLVRVPKPDARGVDYVALEKAIKAMPVMRWIKGQRITRRGPRGGEVRGGGVQVPSLARIRARVMIYTGLPPHMIGALTPDDLQLAAKPPTVSVPPRKKGEGIEARTLPLSPEAVAAFKDFHAANAYGRWSNSAFGRCVRAGFKKAGIRPGHRPYDLRHSFLSQVYRVTRDHATVQRLGLHAEGSPTTFRYTKVAHEDVDVAAVAAFSASLETKRRASLKSVPAPAQTAAVPQIVAKVARKVARSA